MQADKATIRKFLEFAMRPGECLELRIFGAVYSKSGYLERGDRFTATYCGYYDRPDALIVDACRARGVSVYVTLNPVNPALLARSDNKLIKAKHGALDEDVTCLRFMYVDIDPVRPADISSTNEELRLALAKRDLIFSEFPEMRKCALTGCSGNGAFIFVRLDDYPNDAEHRARVAGVVNHLSKRFSDDRVKVDPTTKNPSRVAVLPGTWKTKGSNRPERPWRISNIQEI